VTRLLRWATAATLALLVMGCAVGRFLAGAPATRSAANEQGLLARRCVGCHAIPDPRSMSRATWDAALERMHRRIPLPASEWDSLAAMGREE
jgi:hypothetical protein